MMRRTRTASLLATATTVVLALTACGGSSGGSAGGGTGKVSKGGTLVYLAPQDFDNLDPQRTYTAEGQGMDELIVRSLTGWQEAPGQSPKLVGDLATDTGTASDNDTVWTFHLRPGIKYQDGSTVTSYDVKYGVERIFSSDITGGPGYAAQWLVGGSSYTGPYQGKSLASIVTPDASTISFHLNQPVPDFNETTAMPAWSAVPKAHDTGANYNTGVWSDGPYQIKSYQRGKELVLVRNTYWSQATDPIRQQNVDEIDMKQGLDPATIDQELVSDSGTATDGVQEWAMSGSDLSSETSNPQLKNRLNVVDSGGVSYLALNVNTIKSLQVRQAIEYAINKITARGAFGGTAYGDIASTMLAPSVSGHKDFNLYSTDPSGDLTKAKALMAQAGNPKLTLSLATQNLPSYENFADTVKASLANIGITVNIVPIAASNYFNTMTDTKDQYDMGWMDWYPDWPSASTVLPDLFDGAQIKAQPQSNQDVSYLNDPAVNSQIAKIAAMTDEGAADTAYGNLDEQIMGDASVVPLTYLKITALAGSHVGGLIPDPVNSVISLARVYIKQ
jgi:peptide/nickel transport system substrate-binding protein